MILSIIEEEDGWFFGFRTTTIRNDIVTRLIESTNNNDISAKYNGSNQYFGGATPNIFFREAFTSTFVSTNIIGIEFTSNQS